MDEIRRNVELPALSRGGWLAAGGIGLAALVLVVASSFDWSLGLPTFLTGAMTAFAIMMRRASPWKIAKGISWSVLPLVAGLFVLAQAVEDTGLLHPLVSILPSKSEMAPNAAGMAVGAVLAVLCNVLNNLPLGLLAGSVANAAHLAPRMTGAMLIGVDLGPNLSVTGSLATMLWLMALRREGQPVSAWTFFRLGCLVMPPALIAAMLVFMARKFI